MCFSCTFTLQSMEIVMTDSLTALALIHFVKVRVIYDTSLYESGNFPFVKSRPFHEITHFYWLIHIMTFPHVIVCITM